MDVTPVIPARQALIDAMHTNRLLGHENYGFLSDTHGIMPVTPPLRSLGPLFAVWDEIAYELPDLCRSLIVRKRLDSMPLLRVDNPQILPDTALLRASAIISAFAHAYHYIGIEPPAGGLPPAIRIPWDDIARRLHRREAHMSYIDISTYNWRVRDAACHDPLRVENLDLLVAVWGNEAERIFLAATIETQAKSTPLINAIIQAQEAAVLNDTVQLAAALSAMIECLHHLAQICLPKISPCRNSPFFVDSVAWAKTIAPLSVPIRKGAAGPVGAATASFQALDVFLERNKYQGRVAHESILVRDWSPKHWRDFYEAVRKISVPGYLKKKSNPMLNSLFQEVLDAYAGENGYLGRHRIKTYGYMETAFKSGRSATAAFEGSFSGRSWEHIDEALKQAQLERYNTPQEEPPPKALPAAETATGGKISRVIPPESFRFESVSFRISDIALHNNDNQGYWLIIDELVYDISVYAHEHPGGFKILRAYCGMDATAAYRRVGHHQNLQVQAMLAAYKIGALHPLPHLQKMPDIQALYARWVAYLYLIVEIENALYNEFSFQNEAATSGETDSNLSISPAKLMLHLKTHKRFFLELLPQIIGETLIKLWQSTSTPGTDNNQPDLAALLINNRHVIASEKVAANLHEQLLEQLDRYVRTGPDNNLPTLQNLHCRCILLECEDHALLSQLKLIIRRILQRFEKLSATENTCLLLTSADCYHIHEALQFYYKQLAVIETIQGGPLIRMPHSPSPFYDLTA